MNAPKKKTNEQARKWQVRGYQKGDEAQAAPLFNQIFDKSVTISQYRWKLIDFPWPVGTATTWYADADGKIVGQYASTAMRLWLNRQEMPIVHVCDVMTHPDFRRQGILSAVGEAAHRAWAENGVALVTGFPHKGWGTRSKYLNWQTMFHADWMWKPLGIDQMLKDRLPIPNVLSAPARAVEGLGNILQDAFINMKVGDIEIESIRQPDADFDQLWEQLKSRYEAVVIRDRAWVQYRYMDAPGYGYGLLLARQNQQPIGYLAYRLRQLESGLIGYIPDIFTAPDDTNTRLALIHAAIKLFYKAGAKAALAVVSQKTSMMRPFRLAGFFKRFGAFDVSIVPLQENLNYDAMKDPDRWFAMGGDFDII